ncbi:hypothetical protein AB9X87_02810 [Lactiplantibacillus plantarum]|uniref:hypothetical protein n=1 Tax=Lactiplantibacillus plantarum TaxID=1590 RepID=UPI003524022B
MTMNYDAYSLGNRGNGLPLYDNYLTFATQNATDKGWFKAADFNLQRNATNVKNLYNRRINRIFLTAIVYDGDADVMQALGLLTISAWVPLSDTVEQIVHTNISLKGLLNDNNLSISNQLEARIYSKKVVNEDTDEYNVQIWFNAKQFFSKVALHPLQCDFSRPPYNPHSILDNYFSNNYERLTELFKNMGSTNGLSDSELDTSMQGYSYVTTDSGPYIETFYTTTDQYNIGDGVEYVNVASKDNSSNTLSKIIPDKRNTDGRIIYLCNWNNVVLKNGGNIQGISTLHDTIICPDGKDYVMKSSQLLPLIRFSGNWFPLSSGGVQ